VSFEDVVSALDLSRGEEPTPTPNLRELLEAWLQYQRREFLRKLRDLTPEQVAAWAVPPLELSVLGLVRHMTQMEHVYLAWGLGGGDRVLIYGDDDYAGGSPETAEEDLRTYLATRDKSDSAIAALTSLEANGLGHGQPLGATLIKMIDEYALHSGEAHVIRFAALGELRR
jgi:hypothetical protein